MRRCFSSLIQAGELFSLLKSGKKVHILEAGFSSGLSLHQKNRLPTAKYFDIEEVADQKTNFPCMLADQDSFRKAMRMLRVPMDDAEVVCYDRTGIVAASRVWWNLMVYGRRNVRVLDGGLPQWMKAQGEIATDEYHPTEDPQDSGYDYTLDLTYCSTFETVKAISILLSRSTPQATTQLLDVRPPAKFLGLIEEDMAGLRGGHIPGAINLPLARLISPKKTLHSKDTLAFEFKEAGVSLDERSPTIVYCHSGVTAAVGMLAMMELGKKNVSVYDGSWCEFVGVKSGHASACRGRRVRKRDGDPEFDEENRRNSEEEVVSKSLGRGELGTEGGQLRTG